MKKAKVKSDKRPANQRPGKRGTIRVVDGKVVRSEEEIGAGSRTNGSLPLNNYRTLPSRGRGDQPASWPSTANK